MIELGFELAVLNPVLLMRLWMILELSLEAAGVNEIIKGLRTVLKEGLCLTS